MYMYVCGVCEQNKGARYNCWCDMMSGYVKYVGSQKHICLLIFHCLMCGFMVSTWKSSYTIDVIRMTVRIFRLNTEKWNHIFCCGPLLYRKCYYILVLVLFFSLEKSYLSEITIRVVIRNGSTVHVSKIKNCFQKRKWK